MSKKRKSNVPAFIPNRPSPRWYIGIDPGEMNRSEERKQRENQKKLSLKNQ